MLKFLEKHFGVLMFSGLFVGLLVGYLNEGALVDNFEFYLAAGLFLLLLFSVLKVDFGDFRKSLKRVDTVAWVSFLKLIALPFIVFWLTGFLDLEYRAGLVLLAAAPAAVATPGLLVILGGDIAMGLLLAVVTNLLSPITIPLLLKYTIGTEIEIDLLEMFQFLTFMVVVPFILGWMIKKHAKKLTERVNQYSSGLITIIIFLLIVAAVAPYTPEILANPDASLWALALVAVLAVFLHLFGWLTFAKAGRDKLVTNIVVMAYFNNALVLVLAVKYFGPITVLVTLLYEFVWAFGLIPMQKIFAKKKVG